MTPIRFFRTIAAIITLAFLFILYLIHIGALEISLLPFISVTLLSFSILFYINIYHEFSDDDVFLRRMLNGVLSVILLASLFLTTIFALFDTVFPDLDFSIQELGVLLPPNEFLPEWWLLIFLIPAGMLLAVGAIRESKQPKYTTPSGLHELVESPVYFGLVYGIIGLWGVLFIGLNLFQRVVIVAPIFEELLKFGVALVIGVGMFGKSRYSRIGIALVIGCIFGLVEHSITYAAEPDIFYLHRVLFHSISTMLAVAVYTSLEEHGLNEMLWIAPIYPIILHYLNNGLSVISGVVLFFSSEDTQVAVSLFFGILIIILGFTLLTTTLFRHDIVETLHREPYSFLKTVI